MTVLQTTWHHLRRSPFQSLVALFIMTICFFAINSFALISRGFSTVLRYFETKPEVTIFLKDGLSKNTIESLQKELTNYPHIRQIKFISKEKALDIYKQENKDNPLLTEMVTASILPASFEVSVSDPAVLEQIAQNFSAKSDQVDEIIYQKDIVESILYWTKIIRQSGLIIICLLAAIAFIIISVIIGLKITNRKEEIRISRLLGASKFYVKKSFLLEGFIYGLVGSLVGIGLSLGLAFYFSSRINQFFHPIVFINTSDLNYYLTLVFTQLAAGISVGYLASWFGVRRYIKY